MAKKVIRGRSGAQVRKERAGTWTPAKREEMLNEIAVTLNISASCAKVKMSEPGFYALRRRDAGFRADVAGVIAAAHEQMELRCLERSVKGDEKPVFHAGEKIGQLIEYPDRVTATLLRAHRETAIRVRQEEAFRAEELELAKIRLAERLSDMNRRMGGKG